MALTIGLLFHGDGNPLPILLQGSESFVDIFRDYYGVSNVAPV